MTRDKDPKRGVYQVLSWVVRSNANARHFGGEQPAIYLKCYDEFFMTIVPLLFCHTRIFLIL